MTQIPEAGSKWVHNASGATWKVVFADAISVLIEGYDGIRKTFDADDFKERFSPIPRKIKHQGWVNLYADGRGGFVRRTKEDALDSAGKNLAETRLIEWEIEE